MSEHTTRRHFLKLSAMGLTAALTGEGLLPSRSPAIAGGMGGIAALTGFQTWTTDGNHQLFALASKPWRRASEITADETILINPNQRFQSILGFGGAFTDAACYTFSQMSDSGRQQILDRLFSPTEMGLSVCRTCIGSSDYSTKMYSFDEGDPDPELKRFSIAHDEEYILPVLRQARKINPDLFLFSSPWSPPGWMKSNNSMLGGAMRRHYMDSYAVYFVKFLKAYEEAGVPVQAVTIQNEVDTDQDGRMPACIWPQEYEADFVRQNLGPLFAQQGIKTEIWIIDHNYNLWGRACGELETPDFRKYSNSIAWHGYLGEPSLMARVHDEFPDVNMYWTEGGPDYSEKDYLTGWTKWSKTFTGILRNWCRSITVWNLSLDEEGKPNIGPFPCGGLVTINAQTKEISYSGQYWALSHFSRFIKRGARRLSSESKAKDLDHVVFENQNQQKVAVITNSGPARTIALQYQGLAACVDLTTDSVTTVVWPA
jgi:glucosylceramidase